MTTPQQRRMERARRHYTVLRRRFLADKPTCAVCVAEDAPTPATEVHHMRGRGRFFLAVETWLPICRTHHQRVTLNPTWALDNGWSQSKFGDVA